MQNLRRRERTVLSPFDLGLFKGYLLNMRRRRGNFQRAVLPYPGADFDSGEDRLLVRKPHRQLRIGLEPQHDAIGLPEQSRGQETALPGDLRRHIARIVTEKLAVAVLQDDEFEMRQLDRRRIEAEVAVDAHMHVIMQRLPAFQQEKADLDGLAIAHHRRAKIGKDRSGRLERPVVGSDRTPQPERIHLPRDFLDRAFHADYPMEEETLNTAIRMAMATKPTTPAIATIRIGSRALVKDAMLRSMSFW